ncbi:TetR/AcrR family transcriptional regulator [Megalodesulfovibrio paquesii]
MARPQKEQAIDIPQRAVEAAIALISAGNSLHFTLAQLSRAIGCSPPALYNHFADKEALLDAVRREATRRHLVQKRTLYSQQQVDPVAVLREGGRRYLEQARGNPALYRLMYGLADPPRPADESVLPDEAVEALAEGVRACQALGLARHIDANALAKTFWCAVHGAALAAMAAPPGAGETAAWQEASAVVDTLLELLQPPAPSLKEVPHVPQHA